MYRPKGWERDKPKPFVPPVFYGLSEPAYIDGYTDGVEAGADAMLEGLRKEGHNGRIVKSLLEKKGGYLIFISEEEL